MVLSVGWGVTDCGAILFLGVAAPHAVDGFFACKEVVAILRKHLGVAKLNSYLVELALSVSVSQETDLVCAGDDSLYVESEFVLAVLLLAVVHWV